MEVTAAMVKELRELTGAGMMDCKKALQESSGDMDAASDYLRKTGIAKAARKEGRIAAEGVIKLRSAKDRAILLEINSETDFVAKDANFLAFADAAAETALEQGGEDVSALLQARIKGGSGTVEGAMQELIAKIGEKISVRRMAMIRSSSGRIGSYVHGSRIGVLVEMQGGDDEVARDVAMHIAASRPVCTSEDQVSRETLDKEREIFAAQAAESGKPPEIVAKMVEGRVAKFVKEITLLGQLFIKDPEQTVGKLLKAKGATVSRFVRFEVGEGIEKKTGDFAAEVMAQAGLQGRKQ